MEDKFLTQYDAFLLEMRRRRREPHILGNGFEAKELCGWSKAAGLSLGAFLERLAIEIIADFYVKTLAWDFCDRLLNNLWTASLDLEVETTDIFYDAFQVFEDAEHLAETESIKRSREHAEDFLKSVSWIIDRG